MNSVNPSRVLILTQRLGMGGLEKTIVRLAAGLVRGRRYSPVLYAYDQDPKDSPWISEIHSSGIPLITQVKAPGFSWAVVKEILRQVRHEGIQIVHTHDLNALLYGALAKWYGFLKGTRFKLVHTQHTFLHLIRWKYRLYERIFPHAADCIVCPSVSLQKTYAKHGFHKTLEIRNGIDFPTLGLTPSSRTDWLQRGVQEPESLESYQSLLRWSDKKWILILGRVAHGKGQENFLRLWPRLSASTREKLCVLMVGPANDYTYLKFLQNEAASMPDSDRIVWIGGTRRPQEWMGVSDVFLSLSDFEGMPLAPSEAALCGTPLILSDISGHRDLDLPGVVFVPMQDALALEAALHEFKAPDTAKLEALRKVYDLTNMVGAYEKVFDRLLLRDDKTHEVNPTF